MPRACLDRRLDNVLIDDWTKVRNRPLELVKITALLTIYPLLIQAWKDYVTSEFEQPTSAGINDAARLLEEVGDDEFAAQRRRLLLLLLLLLFLLRIRGRGACG